MKGGANHTVPTMQWVPTVPSGLLCRQPRSLHHWRPLWLSRPKHPPWKHHLQISCSVGHCRTQSFALQKTPESLTTEKFIATAADAPKFSLPRTPQFSPWWTAPTVTLPCFGFVPASTAGGTLVPGADLITAQLGLTAHLHQSDRHQPATGPRLHLQAPVPTAEGNLKTSTAAECKCVPPAPTHVDSPVSWGHMHIRG